MRNIKCLRIDPGDIDLVFLFHMHWDHTGGLYGIIANKKAVTVFLSKSYSKRFKEDMKKQGAQIVDVQGPVRICKAVFSSGELGKSIKEQSLVVRTNRGSVVITGCAHPGMNEIEDGMSKGNP